MGLFSLIKIPHFQRLHHATKNAQPVHLNHEHRMLKVFDDLSRRGGLLGGLFKKMSADMRNQLAQQQPQQSPIAPLSSQALQVPDTTAQGQPQPQPGNTPQEPPVTVQRPLSASTQALQDVMQRKKQSSLLVSSQSQFPTLLGSAASLYGKSTLGG